MKPLPLCAYALLTFSLHFGALKNPFYWDDRALILEGRRISSLKYLPELFANEMWYNVDLGRQAPTTSVDTYRPLLNASFMLDYQWSGLNPMGYHATNLLIHVANCFLLFLIASKFIPKPYAFFCGLLFCVHPITTECIEYVSARADSLMLAFFLASLLAGLRPPSVSNLMLMGVFFLASTLVKETGLTLPAVLLIFLNHAKRDRNALSKTSAVLAAILLFYFGVRFMALSGSKAVKDSQQLLEFIANYPAYLARILQDFSLPHRVMPMNHFELNQAILSACGCVAFTLLIAAFYLRGKKLLLALWASFMIVPAPSFMAVSLTTVINPRYEYAGAAFLSFFTLALLHRAFFVVKPRALHLASWVCVLTLLAWLSFKSSEKYRNEESFYQNILIENPHHVEAEYNLANTYYRSSQYERARAYYLEVLSHQPRSASALHNLGLTYLKLGRIELAKRALQRALSLDPTNEKYRSNLKAVDADDPT